MLFGLLVGAYREKAGLSVRQLAKIIGVEHTKLWRFERGNPVESTAWVRIIAWALTSSIKPTTKNRN